MTFASWDDARVKLKFEYCLRSYASGYDIGTCLGKLLDAFQTTSTSLCAHTKISYTFL